MPPTSLSRRRASRLLRRAGERQGYANAKGLHVYVSYSLAGWKVGLQPRSDGSTRVWFFDVLLGCFVAGRDGTIQPCAETDAPGTADVVATAVIP